MSKFRRHVGFQLSWTSKAVLFSISKLPLNVLGIFNYGRVLEYPVTKCPIRYVFAYMLLKSNFKNTILSPACKAVSASSCTISVTKKSKSSEIPLSEAAVGMNGDGPCKLVRQSSLPSSSERSAYRRKKVNKKLNHVSSLSSYSNLCYYRICGVWPSTSPDSPKHPIDMISSIISLLIQAASYIDRYIYAWLQLIRNESSQKLFFIGRL